MNAYKISINIVKLGVEILVAMYRLYIIIVVPILLFCFTSHGQTVCRADQFSGPNLVENGGFEQGDTLFETEIGHSWNQPPNQYLNKDGNTWSEPDEYYVGNSPIETLPNNENFQDGFEGSPHTGDDFLMVDGSCDDSTVIWRQEVTIEEGYYYFFSAYISTIAPQNPTNEPARLRFRINGVDQDTLISAPDNTNEWIRYDQIWYSDTFSGSMTIEIVDVFIGEQDPGYVCGEDNEDDFGLDDIIFQKGCPPSLGGPVPDLGPDTTLCGTDGTITLDPGITPNPDIEIYWSTGVNDGDYTLDVSSPGTYHVCVDSANTCIRADSIHVRDDFSVDLGENRTLCSPASDTLDAGHSGPEVTYRWYKDDVLVGKERYLGVNASGTYKAVVTDDILPTCGEQEDSVDVDVTGGAPDPNNQVFCGSGADTTVELSVTGSGNYEWYDAPTGGNNVASGTNSFTTPTISGPGDYPYYVEDIAIATNELGPGSSLGSGSVYNNAEGYAMTLEASQDFDINEVTVKLHNYSSTGDFDVGVRLYNGDGSSVIQSSDLQTVTLNGGGVGTIVTIPVVNFPTIIGDSDNPITYNIEIYGTDNFNQGPFYVYNNEGNFPYTIEDGGVNIVSLTGGYEGEIDNDNWNTTDYGPFRRMEIEHSSSCDRTPVLASWNCALPVEMVTFNGTRQARDQVMLHWLTASEKNNEKFEIWHSYDGKSFDKYGEVPGMINSSNQTYYEQLVFSDRAYFKLVQVDLDGQRAESNIVYVPHDSTEISVYPNPSAEHFTLETQDGGTELSVKLLDMTGKVLWTENSVSTPYVFGDGLPKGNYLLKVMRGDEAKVIKLIKFR